MEDFLLVLNNASPLWLVFVANLAAVLAYAALFLSRAIFKKETLRAIFLGSGASIGTHAILAFLYAMFSLYTIDIDTRSPLVRFALVYPVALEAVNYTFRAWVTWKNSKLK